MVAYETAQLIFFSVNAPKKMPKYKPASARQEIPEDVQTDMVRAWFMSKVD